MLSLLRYRHLDRVAIQHVFLFPRWQLTRLLGQHLSCSSVTTTVNPQPVAPGQQQYQQKAIEDPQIRGKEMVTSSSQFNNGSGSESIGNNAWIPECTAPPLDLEGIYTMLTKGSSSGSGYVTSQHSVVPAASLLMAIEGDSVSLSKGTIGAGQILFMLSRVTFAVCSNEHHDCKPADNSSSGGEAYRSIARGNDSLFRQLLAATTSYITSSRGGDPQCVRSLPLLLPWLHSLPALGSRGGSESTTTSTYSPSLSISDSRMDALMMAVAKNIIGIDHSVSDRILTCGDVYAAMTVLPHGYTHTGHSSTSAALGYHSTGSRSNRGNHQYRSSALDRVGYALFGLVEAKLAHAPSTHSAVAAVIPLWGDVVGALSGLCWLGDKDTSNSQSGALRADIADAVLNNASAALMIHSRIDSNSSKTHHRLAQQQQYTPLSPVELGDTLSGIFHRLGMLTMSSVKTDSVLGLIRAVYLSAGLHHCVMVDAWGQQDRGERSGFNIHTSHNDATIYRGIDDPSSSSSLPVVSVAYTPRSLSAALFGLMHLSAEHDEVSAMLLHFTDAVERSSMPPLGESTTTNSSSSIGPVGGVLSNNKDYQGNSNKNSFNSNTTGISGSGSNSYNSNQHGINGEDGSSSSAPTIFTGKPPLLFSGLQIKSCLIGMRRMKANNVHSSDKYNSDYDGTSYSRSFSGRNSDSGCLCDPYLVGGPAVRALINALGRSIHLTPLLQVEVPTSGVTNTSSCSSSDGGGVVRASVGTYTDASSNYSSTFSDNNTTSSGGIDSDSAGHGNGMSYQYYTYSDVMHSIGHCHGLSDGFVEVRLLLRALTDKLIALRAMHTDDDSHVNGGSIHYPSAANLSHALYGLQRCHHGFSFTYPTHTLLSILSLEFEDNHRRMIEYESSTNSNSSNLNSLNIDHTSDPLNASRHMLHPMQHSDYAHREYRSTLFTASSISHCFYGMRKQKEPNDSLLHIVSLLRHILERGRYINEFNSIDIGMLLEGLRYLPTRNQDVRAILRIASTEITRMDPRQFTAREMCSCLYALQNMEYMCDELRGFITSVTTVLGEGGITFRAYQCATSLLSLRLKPLHEECVVDLVNALTEQINNIHESDTFSSYDIIDIQSVLRDLRERHPTVIAIARSRNFRSHDNNKSSGEDNSSNETSVAAAAHPASGPSGEIGQRDEEIKETRAYMCLNQLRIALQRKVRQDALFRQQHQPPPSHDNNSNSGTHRP